MLSFKKSVQSNVCLGFFGADIILAHAKAWDLVVWKCPRHSTTLRSASTFILPPKTPEKCLYLDSDVWAVCFTVLFLWDLFIILSWFLAGSCSVKMSQAFHDPLTTNFHCAWERETRLKYAFILTQTFEADFSRLFLFCLFLTLSFLAKLTVKWGESSRPKIGQ